MLAIKGLEDDDKIEWERVRVLSYYTIAPYHDKKRGKLLLEDIGLPIDVAPEVSEEEKEKRLDNLERLERKYRKWQKADSK